MKTQTVRTVIAAALALAAAGVYAQTATPGADKRQANQEARISQGAASGSLTTREQRALTAQQNRVDRVEERAKADGTVTKAEKAHGAHVQNKASRDIRRQKTDRQGS